MTSAAPTAVSTADAHVPQESHHHSVLTCERQKNILSFLTSLWKFASIKKFYKYHCITTHLTQCRGAAHFVYCPSNNLV